MKKLTCLAMLCAWIAIDAEPSRATLIDEWSPREVTSHASLVFAGTVGGKFVTSERGGHTIVTHYTFGSLDFAKGRARTDSITLNLAGGKYGGGTLIVDGQPSFEIGHRYIVFVWHDLGSEGNLYMPIVGLGQGVFEVRPDPVSKRGVVFDVAGSPVVALLPEAITVVKAYTQSRAAGGNEKQDQLQAKGQAVMRGPRRSLSPTDDPGVRFGEHEFLAAIKAML